MASGITGIFGRPSVGARSGWTHRFIFRDGVCSFFPGGGIIDVTKTRDVMASSDNPYFLRPGTLMGKITSGGRYANSFFGITTGALASAGTSITVSAAQAAEIVRRIGTTGTFTLTGPPAASGVARVITVTFSAVDTATGIVTITALGVNEVQTVNFTTAATGGNVRLYVSKTDGTRVLTNNAAWSATDATFLSNINTVLDAATGVSGGIVATAISATDTDLGFVLTYSGTGYAGNTWENASVQTTPTSVTIANVVKTTTGVDGRMIAGSLVGGTDGSQLPRSFVEEGYGITLFTDPNTAPSLAEWPRIPIAGIVETGQLPYYPSDSGLKTYLRNLLSTTSGNKLIFSDQY